MEWWHWVLVVVGVWCLLAYPIARGFGLFSGANESAQRVADRLALEEANRRDRRESGNGYDAREG